MRGFDVFCSLILAIMITGAIEYLNPIKSPYLLALAFGIVFIVVFIIWRHIKFED